MDVTRDDEFGESDVESASRVNGGYGQANPYEASGGYGAANPYSSEGYGQTVGPFGLWTFLRRETDIRLAATV